MTAAMDFFTVEVWTPRGLVTCYVLFILRLSTRSVHIAGVTAALNGAYIKQVARNLTDVGDGFFLTVGTSSWTALQNTRMISEGTWIERA
jgi:hypothetical protein